MPRSIRIVSFIVGLLFLAVGAQQIQRGVIFYANQVSGKLHSPGGVIAFGFILIVLALLPPAGDGFYQRITTKKPPLDTTFHSHRARSRAHHADSAEDLSKDSSK
jgi:hypothetical protein